MGGAKGLQPLNPFQRTEAVTMAWNAGIQVNPSTAAQDSQESPILALTDIHDRLDRSGECRFRERSICVYGLGIGNRRGRASGLRLIVRMENGSASVDVPPASGTKQRMEISIEVSGVSGIHHLYFVFTGRDQRLFDFEAWQFHH